MPAPSVCAATTFMTKDPTYFFKDWQCLPEVFLSPHQFPQVKYIYPCNPEEASLRCSVKQQEMAKKNHRDSYLYITEPPHFFL